jgi:hypothetical protein
VDYEIFCLQLIVLVFNIVMFLHIRKNLPHQYEDKIIEEGYFNTCSDCLD